MRIPGVGQVVFAPTMVGVGILGRAQGGFVQSGGWCSPQQVLPNCAAAAGRRRGSREDCASATGDTYRAC